MLPNETIERIGKDSDEYARTYTGTKVIKRPYIAGAISEAKRSQKLIEALEKVLNTIQPDTPQQIREMKKLIKDALNEYNNPKL